MYKVKPETKGLAIVLVDDLFEDLEFHYPRLRLIEAGYDVQTVGAQKEHNYNSKHGYWGTTTLSFTQVSPQDVKILVIPGGFCPDKLRRYSECCKLVHDAFQAGAVIAAICHGAWVPISAKIVKGVKMTCFISVKDDLINGELRSSVELLPGAIYDEARCVVDGKIVTAQTPDDLPAFMKAILEVASK